MSFPKRISGKIWRESISRSAWFYWSGQLDSNQRPAVPKTAARCAIPRISLGKRRRYTLAPRPASRQRPFHRPLKSGCATRPPGSIPDFFAVPAGGIPWVAKRVLQVGTSRPKRSRPERKSCLTAKSAASRCSNIPAPAPTLRMTLCRQRRPWFSGTADRHCPKGGLREGARSIR
jgi:hypothetical protein